MSTDFLTFLDTQLNPEQLQAVKHTAGSLLVIAGAGSGKTRVITARIAHLMQHLQVPHSAIVALTFTNKAAHEMKERVARFTNSTTLPFVGTFHAYCLQLLKQFKRDEIFSIIDSDDQEKLIKTILERHNLSKQFTVKSIAYQISQLKCHKIEPAAHAELFFKNPIIFDIYQQYEAIKRANKSLDFDDLLLEALNLFKDPIFKERFSSRVRHVLVDEYQDTNTVQHALLKAIALAQEEFKLDSLCVVGDEDQSIYSWRGATVENMRTFYKDFPATTIIKIERNYRSVQPILDIANTLIECNTQRNTKTLWSDKQGKNAVVSLACGSEYQESDAVIHAITNIRAKQPEHEIAILYRTHTQSRALEENLIRWGIAYKIIGGTQFYDRMEIKDLLGYLKLVVNPYDRVSFLRIINTPNRSLGQASIDAFMDIWSYEPFLHYKEVIAHAAQQQAIPAAKISIAQNFIHIFKDLEPATRPKEALERIIERSSYVAYLKRAYDEDDATARIDNIKELLAAVHHFEQEGCVTVQQFLEEIALMQDKLARTQENKQAVMLMTLHAAKGLEFDTVLLTGIEENLLPTPRSLQEPHGLQEERRLFYVGITRACKHLILMHAKNRYTYGSLQKQLPSRFLQDISSTNIPSYDCTYWDKSRFNLFFSAWFGGRTPQEQPMQTYKPHAPAVSEFNQYIPKNTNSFSAYASKKVVVPEKASTHFAATSHGLRANCVVKHTTYGLGTVQHIEEKNNDQTFATVKFACGIKKILAKFLQKI